MSDINYKFNEKNYLEEIQSYVDATYGSHYSQNKFQTTEVVVDNLSLIHI